MRHKIAHRKLNRTAEHRKALIKNMLNSLIKHEQIETTLPKAKELKVAIDVPLRPDTSGELLSGGSRKARDANTAALAHLITCGR